MILKQSTIVYDNPTYFPLKEGVWRVTHAKPFNFPTIYHHFPPFHKTMSFHPLVYIVFNNNGKTPGNTD